MALNRPISQLTTKSRDWNISVRCTRKFYNFGHKKELLSMEVVLIDAEGTRVHGFVDGPLVGRFSDDIQEGDVYNIRNFEVSVSPRVNPLLVNPIMINFIDSTSVLNVVDLGFQLTRYKFVSFDQITEQTYPYNGPLFDVIGHLIDIDDTMMYGDGSGGHEYIRFVISDLNNNQRDFLLFPPFTNEVNGYLDMWWDYRLNKAIVIIELCNTMLLDDKFVLCNTFNATRLTVYNHIDEAIEYSQWMA